MTNYGYCFKSIFDKNDYEECEKYYKIYFTNDDRFAIISKESFDVVSKYKWHIRPDGYVEAKNKNKENILLHRLVTNFQYPIVDHINRNKLDNRLNNLRCVTASQNQVNKSIQKNNTSGITGVSWDKSRNKWHVMITVNHNHINLGRFDSLEEAREVRRKAEKIYHKEYSPITKTDFLISNNIDSTSSKNKKAKQLNIPIVDEEYIIGMLSQ